LARVRIAGEVDDLLATHHRVTGARRDSADRCAAPVPPRRPAARGPRHADATGRVVAAHTAGLVSSQASAWTGGTPCSWTTREVPVSAPAPWVLARPDCLTPRDDRRHGCDHGWRASVTRNRTSPQRSSTDAAASWSN